MTEPNTAVLLMAFGGAESLEEVAPFLQNITKGRKPTLEMVEQIKERYRLIGGKSPLREITLRQAQALQDSLETRNKGVYRTFIGMRHWHPYIGDVLHEIHKEKINRITAIIMAPQSSGYIASGYQKDLSAALKCLVPKPNVKFISDWHSNRNFHEALAEKVLEGVSVFKNREKTAVIFSAHSLPEKFMEPQDPYEKQIEETIKGVITITGSLNWKLGYQSKGMIPGDWLEPTVDSIIEGLPKEGFENVVIAPVGFVADHVETLYDIDIVYRQKAESIGLKFNRAPSLNDSPKFIDALTDIILNK